MIDLLTLGLIPHWRIANMECRRMMRLVLNLWALVMVVMVCLVFPHMIWHSMSNLSLSLTLCLGALSFLTMRRGLGEVVEATSHIPPRSRVSDPIRIPDPRRVTIGNNTYIISQVPSSSVPSSSNVHPPPHSRGPSGRNIATSHVHTLVTQPVVS